MDNLTDFVFLTNALAENPQRLAAGGSKAAGYAGGSSVLKQKATTKLL